MRGQLLSDSAAAGVHKQSISTMFVVYQLIKIYGSKRPGYRLLMYSSGCTITQ